MLCPTLACGFTYSSAISGSNGCAWALSQVSSAAYSPTYFRYLRAYIAAQLSIYDAGNPMPDPTATVAVISKVMGEALSVSLIDAIQFVCAKPLQSWSSCKTCSTCKANNATSIVKVRACMSGRDASCCSDACVCMHAGSCLAPDQHACAAACCCCCAPDTHAPGPLLPYLCTAPTGSRAVCGTHGCWRVCRGLAGRVHH